MSQLFKRNLFAQVGDLEEAVEIPNTFKIGLSIKKLISSTSSEGNVTFFNLSDDTRESIRDKGKRIRVFAGYGNDVALLHDGDILRTAQDDEGADRKTIIYLAGRSQPVNNAIFTKSYQNSVSIRQIIADAIPTFNLTFNQAFLSLIPANATLPEFSFHGKTNDVINQLLSPLNLQWFERNSEVLFSDKNKSGLSTTQEAIVLSSNSGLIKSAVQTDKGVNATCLLNPRLIVGGLVNIKSDVVQNASFNTFQVKKIALNTQGFYKIIQATYEGDNWDGKFQALLQCVPFNQSQESTS
ncbi:MAG: hypothetical protein V3V61_01265 [Gammaproteobacteria bacterium]